MSRPEDESSTELAWREIVDNYGERAVLPDERTGPQSTTETPTETPDDSPTDGAPGSATWTATPTEQGPAPGADGVTPDHPEARWEPKDAGPGPLPSDLTGELPDRLLDDDEVEARQRAVAESERFRPPPAPPFPVPRTWQRGLAWAGIFVAPALALVIALFSIYLNPLFGWLLVLWFVGGFLYLVLEMPRSPRDPWDDGSRV